VKTRRKVRVLEERFQKVGDERNFQANLQKYEFVVLDQTLSQFCTELRKEGNTGITGEISKIKSLSTVYHPR